MALTPIELKKILKGRTPDQQNAIKYFAGSGGGCLAMFSTGISDDQYESMVMTKASKVDFRKKALAKIGLDESQVNEIEPVHFEGYALSERKPYPTAKFGGGKWRTPSYQVSWIFFSSTQVYAYQYTFRMDDDTFKERTEEYFYKDITNFSTSTDSKEEEVIEKINCKGEPVYSRKTAETNNFSLVVPGERFNCSMEQSDYTERAIQGMKQKLREKKG